MRAVVQGGSHTSLISTASTHGSIPIRSVTSCLMKSMQGQAVAVKVRSTRAVPRSKATP